MFCLFLVYMFVYPVTKLTNWVMNKHQLVVRSIKREINFQFCYSSLCLYYPSLIIFFLFLFLRDLSLSHSHSFTHSLSFTGASSFFFSPHSFILLYIFFCLNFYNQSTLLLYSYTLVIIFGHYKEVIRIR